MTPKISVVIPAYNSEKYIVETIESILSQTFKDFECLIINDASTDTTAEIVKIYSKKDSRIILVDNKYEKGIVGGLNTGFDLAQGEYIVRIDSDDIAYPERFQKQVEFMDANPNIAVSGSAYEMFGIFQGPRKMPLSSNSVKITMLFYGAIAHPTAILRKSVIDKYNFRYDQNYIWAEDLDLWLRISKVGELANLPDILLKYRTHESSVGKVYNSKQADRVKEIHLRELDSLGLKPTEDEIAIHEKIGTWEFKKDFEFLVKAKNWFSKIREANNKINQYDESELTFFLTNKLFDIYKASKSLKWSYALEILKFFINDSKLELSKKVKLFLKIFYVKLKY